MYVIRACTILIALNLADAFLENIINEAIVSLQENIYGKVWAHICTGVLVGKPKLMLTAAHCFENKMDLVKERPGIRGTMRDRLKVPYSREQKHVSISDTPMLLIEINSISNMGCQK